MLPNEDRAMDLEQSLPEPEPNSSPVEAVASVQELQMELQTFLTTHTERLLALKNSCSPVDSLGQRPASNITFPGSIQKNSPTSPVSPQKYAAVSLGPAEAHAKHLKKFLDAHLESIGSLRDALLRAPHSNGHVSPVASSPLPHGHEKAFEGLGSQFNMLVVISTFTASLIVSFLSLVKSIVVDDHRVAFDVGMLLSCFAMSLHFGNIIVAGRGSALTSQHSTDDVGHDLAYFHHYLQLCEQLQFFATLMFLLSVVQLTFIMFHRLLYPLVLLGVAAVGSLIVFWSAYWKVSMTFRNLMFLTRRARGLRVRARSLSLSKQRPS